MLQWFVICVSRDSFALNFCRAIVRWSVTTFIVEFNHRFNRWDTWKPRGCPGCLVCCTRLNHFYPPPCFRLVMAGAPTRAFEDQFLQFQQFQGFLAQQKAGQAPQSQPRCVGGDSGSPSPSQKQPSPAPQLLPRRVRNVPQDAPVEQAWALNFPVPEEVVKYQHARPDASLAPPKPQ